MRVLFINHTCGIGSTGRICAELAERYIAEGHEAVVAYGRGTVPERYRHVSRYFGSRWNLYVHGVYTRLTDKHGWASKCATRALLRWAEKYNPDVLWLHNIHGYYLNVELLFAWIKARPQMQVKWTLHDCWAFTGHCTNFGTVGCERWKHACAACPQRAEYPASLVDNSRANFARKRATFTGASNLTLITPSQWLAELVQQSFLGEYPVEVHPNTVDTAVFKPTPSDFRKRYGLQDSIMVLGVANVWQTGKGLPDLLELAARLDDRYRLVLVGLTDKQKAALPPQVIGITRTHDPKELAEIYSAADIYVSPSREETFGVTVLEAALCGVPHIIVYAGTASEEVIAAHHGMAIEPNVDALYTTVRDCTERRG